MVKLADISKDWRTRADDMDRAAKSYNRACVKEKGMQLILLAKQLRGCAHEIEQTAEYANTAPTDTKPKA
jgi:hypothetical protein